MINSIMCRLSKVKRYYDQESYIIIQHKEITKQIEKNQMIHKIKLERSL